MPDPPLDRIHITDLALRCIVGINAEERREKQDLQINLTLHTDLRRACPELRVVTAVNAQCHNARNPAISPKGLLVCKQTQLRQGDGAVQCDLKSKPLV